MSGVFRTTRRRRKEGKTDYKARLALLKSGKPRVLVRKTNRYIIGQVVVSEDAKDKIVAGVNSKELLERGWPKEMAGSLKSLPAAYLAGFFLGKKSAEIKEGILDIGLQRNVKGSRLYAFLKGLIDAGFSMTYDEEALTEEKMLHKNEKIKKLINGIKESLS